MAQYHPTYHACDFPELNRRIRPEEYQEVIRRAEDLGLCRLDI